VAGRYLFIPQYDGERRRSGAAAGSMAVEAAGGHSIAGQLSELSQLAPPRMGSEVAASPSGSAPQAAAPPAAVAGHVPLQPCCSHQPRSLLPVPRPRSPASPTPFSPAHAVPTTLSLPAPSKPPPHHPLPSCPRPSQAS
jgi:hypothetical protein